MLRPHGGFLFATRGDMSRESGSSGHVLVDVLDRVLDKGIVIDAAVRISVVGIELLGVDARVVVASIETYLLHADTLAYTDLAAGPRKETMLPPVAPEGGSAPPSAPALLIASAPAESQPPPPPLYVEPADQRRGAPDADAVSKADPPSNAGLAASPGADPASNAGLAASPRDDDPGREGSASLPDSVKPREDN